MKYLAAYSLTILGILLPFIDIPAEPLGPIESVLSEQIRSSDSRIRYNALLSMQSKDHSPEFLVKFFKACLFDSSIDIQLLCLEKVSQYEGSLPGLTDDLEKLVRSPDSEISGASLRALATAKPRREDLIEFIIQLLSETGNHSNIGSWFAKNIFALVAVALSLLSLVLTYLNHRNQNKKWTSLNRPRLIIEDSSIIKFKELEKMVYPTINWGYAPLAAAIVSENLETDQLAVFSFLLFMDPAKNPSYHTRFMTAPEAYRSLATPNAITNLVLHKAIRFYFLIKNAGNLPAFNVEISVDVCAPNSSKPVFRFKGNEPVQELPAQQTSRVPGQIEIPMKEPWPQAYNFTFNITYQAQTKMTIQENFKQSLILSNLEWTHGHYS